VINQTTNITNINISRGGAGPFGGVMVNGPSLAEVNAQAQNHIATVQLTVASQPGRGALNGGSLAVYAPRIDPATLRQAKPGSVAQTLNHPNFNRGDTVTKPLAVTAQVHPAAPSQTAIHAAQQAQSHISAHANIATSKTPVKQTPKLTSLAAVNAPQSHSAQPQTANNPSNQGGENVSPENHAENVHPSNEPSANEHPEEAYHPQNQGGENASPENHAENVHPSNEPSANEHPEEAYHPHPVNQPPGNEQASHPQNPSGSAHPASPVPQATHPAASAGQPAPPPAKKPSTPAPGL
jgi:hypothetical protein